MKTSELTGAALDWAVAKCEDLHTGYPGYWSNSVLEAADRGTENPFAYSTKWTLAGPIIEREGISLLYLYVTDDPFRWAATQKPTMKNVKPDAVYGPTLLIAAMRCLVASKLGGNVDIPEELK